MATSFQSHSFFITLAPPSAFTEENRDGEDPANLAITIRCLPELTPLDMMDMASGVADPTGSCVWLGAFLFMEMFSRKLQEPASDVQRYWSHLRSTLFPPECHAIELGAGTGMSGLSLMISSLHERKCSVGGRKTASNNDTRTLACVGPSLMVLTDVNGDALEFCRINCDANISNNRRECVHVRKLEWSKGSAFKVFSPREEPLPSSYDVVFATDVLYDLQSLAPLVVTASELLKDGGHFILSHVPRAAIDPDCYPSVAGNSWQQLESIIIDEASRVRLSLAKFIPFGRDDPYSDDVSAAIKQNNESDNMILRPILLRHIWKDPGSLSNKYSWQNMIDVGAAVLVFCKEDAKS